MNKIIIRREVPKIKLATNLHPLLEKVYLLRGISCSDELERGLEHLLPYNKLLGIEVAVNCIYQALCQQKHMVVIGDFDADGATSTALAVTALRSFGAERVSYLLPNRFEYGYGLTPEIVEVAATRKPDVLITVDNGISSLAGVARAKALGLQVIITDHHLPGAELPGADAIVNPNLVGDPFPSKHLAGVGVIFYVMLALRAKLRETAWFSQTGIPEPNMSQFLDLVALGTVADVVPLDKNNRILVHQGLNRIRAGKVRPGIQNLLEVAGKTTARLRAADLGFVVAPRLNAAGRLDDMSLGVECLLATDSNAARDMAMQLDALNKERQAIEADMQKQAMLALNQLKLSQNLPMGLCMHDESWHQGVIGILAARIKEKTHRPVIAFATVSPNELKGSARSVQGVHIRDVLDNIAAKNPGLISKFGGHAMAAGLSLARNHYEAFNQAFAAEVSQHLSEEDTQGKIYSDGELLPEHFDMGTADLLCNAGPWGQGFPEPLFDNNFNVIEQRLLANKHLKLLLEIPGTSQTIEGIMFNVNTEAWPNHRVSKINAAFRLDINEFRGQTKVQLLIECIFPSPTKWERESPQGEGEGF
jgi:single-stranded-DNA-specific exonuclease